VAALVSVHTMSDPEDMEAKVGQSDLAQSLGADNAGDIGIVQFVMTSESDDKFHGSSKVSRSDDNLKHEATSMSGQRRRGGRRKQFLQRLGLAGSSSHRRRGWSPNSSSSFGAAAAAIQTTAPSSAAASALTAWGGVAKKRPPAKKETDPARKTKGKGSTSWSGSKIRNVELLTRCMGRQESVRRNRQGGVAEAISQDPVQCLSYHDRPTSDDEDVGLHSRHADHSTVGSTTITINRPSVKRKSRDLKQVERDVEKDSLERSSPVPAGSSVQVIQADLAQIEVSSASPTDDHCHHGFLDFNPTSTSLASAVTNSGNSQLRHLEVGGSALFNFFTSVASHRPLSSLVAGGLGDTLGIPTTTTAAVHSQIDCENFLIPHQREIINCPFYWGKIDRYEAEELLADKPEGSFLLRDSAQDDFVFSVSFRRYSRSLHARIEEEDHLFSFDSHDPGVHCSHTIKQLLQHYKDPLSCMFFEPMLLFPVIRKTCFSLQSLARAAIVDSMTGVRRCEGSDSSSSGGPSHQPDSRAYAGVSELPLPKVLKAYLREYHYKHKIRTRYIEVH